MPITAEELYQSAQLDPSAFGSNVDSDASDDQQRQQAIDYIETKILRLATGEVSGPVRKALGDFTSTLDNAGLTAIFGGLASDVIALWDAAETSYGRSELNKQVDSNAAEYDTDSDQDRIQGNQRLAKLIELIEEWRAVGQNPSGGSSGDEFYSTTTELELRY